jgi:hypothetical protein
MSVCPVLLRQPLERLGELVLVGLRLRLDGHRDHRVGEAHGLEQDGRGVDGERLAGRRLLQADERRDLARADLVALFAVVRVHLEDAPDALRLARRRVEHLVALRDAAGVDADVRELPDVGVRHDLEGERSERLVHRRPA